MDKPPKRCTKWKKPDTKEYTVNYSTAMKFRERLKPMSGCLDSEDSLQTGPRELSKPLCSKTGL